MTLPTMIFRQISDKDRKYLRMVFGPAFMCGQCVALAVALHRRTGWPLVSVRNETGSLQHVGVRTPGGLIRDARGDIDDGEFESPWARGSISEEPDDEATLLREDPKIDEAAIAKADYLLDLYFDDLPGSSEKRDRMKAFAEGLRELCERTGIWIRSDGPHGIPIYDADGSEGPFAVSFHADGHARIDRTFRRGD